MSDINRIEVIELCKEMTSLLDEDIEYAKSVKSIEWFENDLELYLYTCNDLMNDLIYLEEYELCSDLKKVMDKMVTSIDR